jgi:hypothetical protein
MPYVVTVLLPDVALPARYKLTPAAGATVMLAVPRFTMLSAVPTGQLTALLSAKVKAKFDALVE